MAKFILNISILIVLMLFILYFISSVKISDEYIIYKTQNTHYDKVAWNLDLINQHPERINGSLIFLGASSLLTGVSDSILTINGIKSLNLSVNYNGNEIKLFFLNKILQYKPKKIYLQLNKEYDMRLHVMTPLLYTPSGLINIGQNILNVQFIKFLFKRVTFVTDYFIWNSFNIKYNNKKKSTYGSNVKEGKFSKNEYDNITSEIAENLFESYNLILKDFKRKNEFNRSDIVLILKRFARQMIDYYYNINFIFNAKCQQGFTLKAYENSVSANIEIAEIYIPIIVDSKSNQNFNHFFYYPRKTLNIVSLNNFSFLNHYSYWSDMRHLNNKGSVIFTKTLIDEKVL